MKKTKVKIDQLINITSPAAAYLLGLAWADGCITPTNSLRIELKKEDAEGLKLVFYQLGPWPTSEIKRKDGRESIVFSVGNKELATFLTQHLYKEKSKSPSILDVIPDELKCLWWRGYSDGDGCFYVKSDTTSSHSSYQYTITGPYEQDWTFAEAVFQQLEITYRIARIIRPEGGRKSYIRCGAKKECRRFGNFIYQTYEKDQIGLLRKYIKYTDMN
jgi:hypothetical protein